MMGEKVSDRVARGRAQWRTRVVVYVGMGGYAGAVVAAVWAHATSGGVAVGVVLFGLVVFWLGRRSALESASAEAHAWAVATATANATSNSLAAVQVNVSQDGRAVELTDGTGLHRRVVEAGLGDGRLSPGAIPIASSNPARVGAVNPPYLVTDGQQARSASRDHMFSHGVDGDDDAGTLPARDGTGSPLYDQWPFVSDDRFSRVTSGSGGVETPPQGGGVVG
ncbi:hypothetical protein [Demequina lutea]|uniref:Uncharacterized protein n=1 Tax=Demequina lutea TaxID=431489 RepID=A0A7Y9Z9Q5_9MICO|nr:hypothetical protein [Demequina lutea]NYI41409.1 hypothetical protein [Demequina lutea]